MLAKLLMNKYKITGQRETDRQTETDRQRQTDRDRETETDGQTEVNQTLRSYLLHGVASGQLRERESQSSGVSGPNSEMANWCVIQGVNGPTEMP